MASKRKWERERERSENSKMEMHKYFFLSHDHCFVGFVFVFARFLRLLKIVHTNDDDDLIATSISLCTSLTHILRILFVHTLKYILVFIYILVTYFSQYFHILLFFWYQERKIVNLCAFFSRLVSVDCHQNSRQHLVHNTIRIFGFNYIVWESLWVFSAFGVSFVCRNRENSTHVSPHYSLFVYGKTIIHTKRFSVRSVYPTKMYLFFCCCTTILHSLFFVCHCATCALNVNICYVYCIPLHIYIRIL